MSETNGTPKPIKPYKAVWHGPDYDNFVTVIGDWGVMENGRRYLQIEEGMTAVPANEIEVAPEPETPAGDYTSKTNSAGPTQASAEARLSQAREYLASGLSLVPIGAGEKRPVGHWSAYQDHKPAKGDKYPTWEIYQERKPTDEEMAKWVSNYPGLGIVGGNVSGKYGAALEILDLECIAPLKEFRELVDEAAPGLLNRLPRDKSPTGGRHVFYRCEAIEGNQKLAQRAEEVDGDDLPR